MSNILLCTCINADYSHCVHQNNFDYTLTMDYSASRLGVFIFYATDSTTRAILCIRCGISVAVSWKFQRNSYTHSHKNPKRSGKDCCVIICQCHTAENYFCSESVEKFKTNNKVYEDGNWHANSNTVSLVSVLQHCLSSSTFTVLVLDLLFSVLVFLLCFMWILFMISMKHYSYC